MSVRIPAVLAFLVLASLRSLAGQNTFFAVAIEGGASIIPAVLRDGQLLAERPSARVFGGVPLRGMTMLGGPVRVQLDSLVPNPEYYDSEFVVRVTGDVPPDPTAALGDTMYQLQAQNLTLMQRLAPGDSAATAAHYQRYGEVSSRWLHAYSTFGSPHAVLIWAGPVAPVSVPAQRAPPDPALVRRLAPIADSLWRQALRDLPPNGRTITYRLGHTFSIRPTSASHLQAVWLQAITSQGDPRGSFFFLLNGDQVTRAGFGHPEWSPNSSIVEVRPYLALRIGSNPALLFLCEYGGAWESRNMWAFIDATTGRLIVPSNAPPPN